MIGIIFAMHEEFEEVIKNINNLQKLTRKNQNFLLFSINNQEFIATYSGIGKVNSAVSTTILISEFNPTYILNIGTAGSTNKNINILDLIIINESFYNDVDATVFGYLLGQIPKEDFIFKTSDKWNKIIIEKLNKKSIIFKIGRSSSGDSFINNKNIQNYKNIFDNTGICADMEITSIIQTANKFNTPIVSIKYISDSIFSDKPNFEFKENMKNISYKIWDLLKAIV